MNILDVQGLCKHYPGFRLDGVSFSVEEGCIMGFIGRNGAGKTTTIKSILNLVHTDGGRVLFEGRDLWEHEADCKKQIGLVLGEFNYYKRKKLRSIAAVTKRFYDDWDESLYQSLLSRFALDPEKKITELSQGMRVKFALALALSHHAKLLILDEPTSGLDPFSRNELLDIFTGLKRDGTAVFFSTHIISDIEKCADDIVYISRGRIVAAMPKEDFISHYSGDGETLEDTMLRLEGGADHA